VLFVVIQRIPSTPGRRERHSVWWTNLAVACFVAAMCWIFGIKTYLLIQLIVTTVAGAGELLRHSPLDAATLRENVTSPGGTTAAALEVLMRADGLPALLREAVAAATKRSRKLAG